MDTEKVIALGFVIHELLGFVGGVVLCYFGYRLLMRRVKVRPGDTHWSWKSTRVLIKNAAPGTLFALFGAVAIWLTASNGFTPKTFGPKAPPDLPVLAATPLPTASPGGIDDRIVMTLRATPPEMNLADRGAIPENPSTINRPPAPTQSPSPILSSTPQTTPRPTPSATPAPALKEPSGAGRKALERERREAERKRSRLEDMYQKHLISSEAYKKGEEEYKTAIEKYRREMNAAGGSEQ